MIVRVSTRRIDEADLGLEYQHDLYEFEASGVKYVARCYTSQPGDAHFLRKEVDGQLLQLTPEDIASRTFREAVAYLREHGKTQVQYLSAAAGGYLDVPS